MADTMALRLRAIGADHPRRRHAVSRMLVEVLLTEEFGDAPLNSAAFQTLIDEVLAAMGRSTVMAAELEEVVDALLASKP